MNDRSTNFFLRKLSLFVALLVAGTFSVFVAAAKDPVYTGHFSNVAVSGYDTVAYFTQGAATKGSDEFSTEWKGAEWRFSSAENLAKFVASPEKYAPQYGGYCAYAAASNQAAKTDPKAWHIHNGKLYLNYNKSVQKNWLQDKNGYIEKADNNWPALLN